MVGVLVDSRREGKTSWVATRGLNRVKVEGIAGCGVQLTCKPSMEVIELRVDGEYDLPEELEFVMAEHIETTKDSRVFVDLVR